MNINKYLSAKVSLNKYIDRVDVEGAAFHIHYWGVMPQHYDTPLHKHSFFEICYVVDGEGTYSEDERTYLLRKNTFIISKPNNYHQIKSENGLFLIYVAFELIDSESSEEWIGRVNKAEQSSNVIFEDKEDMGILVLWKSLFMQACMNDDAFLVEIIKKISASLILSLLRNIVYISMGHQGRTFPKTSSTIFHQATLYIEDNLSSNLKLTEIAKHLHISGRHLSRIFLKEAGISYSEYIQNVRMQRAATLLKTSDLPIKDIAEITGFSTVNYFTRVFTSKFRSSPGKFRSLYSNVTTTKYDNDFISST